MMDYSYVRIESWMTKSERDINNICNDFGKELYNRKWSMSREIMKWRDDLARQINDYADLQTKLLEQEYQKQRIGINDTRQQFIAATRPYEHTGNNVEIDQLIGQCKALKSELGALEYPMESIPYIKFMTEDQLKQKKQSEKMVGRIDDKQSRSSSGGDYDNCNVNDTGAHGVGSSKEAFIMSRQGTRPTTTTATQVSPGQTSSSSNTKDGDNLTNKCPTCFMIFPSYMSFPDRNQHAAEHFQDFK